MSIYYNQTNQTPGTSQFITRQEVIQGFSTLAGDLSGVDFLSSFFVNPNIQVSSIAVNPSGTIQNPGSVKAGNYVVSTNVAALYPTRPYATPNPLLGVTDQTGGVYTDFYAKNFGATNPLNTTTPGNVLLYSYQGITGLTSGGGVQGLVGWNPTNPAGTNFILSNVSTINGIPPNQSQGTFTTLTGSNITMSGQLNVPQVVGVSSINGEMYTASFNSNWTGSNLVNVNNGIAALGASIALPSGLLQPQQTYLYDVGVRLNNFPPAPSNFTLMVGARMGGQGQINYSIPLFVNASAQGYVYNLTGVAETGTTVGTNSLDIVLVQQSGSNWSCSVSAPPGGSGNPNGVTVKPI
jgi:hypothetical protein